MHMQISFLFLSGRMHTASQFDIANLLNAWGNPGPPDPRLAGFLNVYSKCHTDMIFYFYFFAWEFYQPNYNVWVTLRTKGQVGKSSQTGLQ